MEIIGYSSDINVLRMNERQSCDLTMLLTNLTEAIPVGERYMLGRWILLRDIRSDALDATSAQSIYYILVWYSSCESFLRAIQHIILTVFS